jgi:ADP-dependent NAD(P)H-hydrate dehydratase
MNRLLFPELPRRATDSHKGSFGSVLLIGGSRGMSGAITLAGLAALRSGCGLTYLACPAEILPTVAAAEPSYLTVPLPDDQTGRLTPAAWPTLQPLLESCTAVAIGPGCGQSPEFDELFAHVFRACQKPLVIDADGLNSLARQPELWEHKSGPRILTPHPGEMSRLLQVSVAEVQQNRSELARLYAQKHGSIVVLKGAGTIITDGEQDYVNSTGNHGMATGGTGDVLTGVIASLLAQGMTGMAAAQLGVYVHGRAGDLAADHWGYRGLIASDLPGYVALAFRELTD